MDEDSRGGVDLSGLHRQLDALKSQLCRCRHEGTCVACQGFEFLRQQAQTVVAAASQPVLMQVAQEAAVKDLFAQLGGLEEKIAGDEQLQEMFAKVMERIQDDIGGPDAMRRLMEGMGFPGTGFPPGDQPVPPDDRMPKPDDAP